MGRETSPLNVMTEKEFEVCMQVIKLFENARWDDQTAITMVKNGETIKQFAAFVAREGNKFKPPATPEEKKEE